MFLIKVAGSALVLISSALCGIAMGQWYSKRPTVLGRMLSALQLLETEISYGLSPLPDALRSIAGSLGSAESALFIRAAELISPSGGLSVQEAWRKSIDESYEWIGLSEKDADILASLGSSLGISGREDQIKHIALVRENLARSMDEALRESDRMSRLWRSISVYAGLMIIIFLL